MTHLPVHRRTFLSRSVSGFFAFAAANQVAHGFTTPPSGRAKRCILLWMNGGPSQFETFDPKPGVTTGGEVQSIATQVPGLHISETLPHIAKRMQHLSIVKNVTSVEGEHIRGQYFLHTGHRFVPAFPRPSAGSVVAHHSTPRDFPNYVTLGGRGYGPAFLGPDFAPFTIENIGEARELLRRVLHRQSRIEFLQRLGDEFDRQHRGPMLGRRRSMISRIETLADTPFVTALDVERESRQSRSRYGSGEFANACVAARRLLETGVSFVEIQHDGWDTHNDNFDSVSRLCGAIDQPWSALLDDLQASGMLEETLIVWMGEFGRTPNINANRGRDHYPRVTQAVMGGAGLGGQVVGSTDPNGQNIVGEPRTVADLFATIFSTLGIDPDRQYETAFGSPTALTDGGQRFPEFSEPTS